MSIRRQIESLISAGRLYQVEPLDPSLEVKRVMVVSNEIQQLTDGPWLSESLERRANRLRADLEAFVRGQVLSVSMTPYKHRSAYMGLLDPPEGGVWDIRSRDPRPGLRIFGHFAAVDLFVALVWMPRSVEIGGRLPLGNKQDLSWEIAKLECEDAWRALFPGNAPKKGGEIRDFISDGAFLVGD